MTVPFKEIDEILEMVFEIARNTPPETLERISNDHIYFSAIWEKRPPKDYPDELLRYLQHAPDCIDCVEYSAGIHRQMLLEEQDIKHYADGIMADLRKQGIDISK